MRVVLFAEPAPYAIPPMNLWEWEMSVPSKGVAPTTVARPGDITVEAKEGRTPISWADKQIEVRVKE